MKTLSRLLLMLMTISTYGQTCIHKDLSKSYDFKIDLRRIERLESDESAFDSCVIAVIILRKGTQNSVQHINFSANYFFEPVFKDCNSVRSYVTGKNRNDEAPDNDYGDLIVADYNFDGKEDLAIKKDSGGNGGPVYDFYIQNDKGEFVIDKFLTEEMEFFPTIIDDKKKTLTTYVHANVMELSKMVYQLNRKTKSWKRIRHTFVKHSC